MTLDKAKMVSLYKLIDEDDCTLEDVITIKGRTAMDAAEERIIVDDATLNGLTDREKEVLTLSMEGSTVREIGEKLGISHVMVVKLRGKLKEKYAKLKGELKNEVTK
jgi:DNA-directed RNA polymerase specialized sigma subunit